MSFRDDVVPIQLPCGTRMALDAALVRRHFPLLRRAWDASRSSSKNSPPAPPALLSSTETLPPGPPLLKLSEIRKRGIILNTRPVMLAMLRIVGDDAADDHLITDLSQLFVAILLADAMGVSVETRHRLFAMLDRRCSSYVNDVLKTNGCALHAQDLQHTYYLSDLDARVIGAFADGLVRSELTKQGRVRAAPLLDYTNYWHLLRLLERDLVHAIIFAVGSLGCMALSEPHRRERRRLTAKRSPHGHVVRDQDHDHDHDREEVGLRATSSHMLIDLLLRRFRSWYTCFEAVIKILDFEFVEGPHDDDDEGIQESAYQIFTSWIEEAHTDDTLWLNLAIKCARYGKTRSRSLFMNKFVYGSRSIRRRFDSKERAQQQAAFLIDAAYYEWTAMVDAFLDAALPADVVVHLSAQPPFLSRIAATFMLEGAIWGDCVDQVVELLPWSDATPAQALAMTIEYLSLQTFEKLMERDGSNHTLCSMDLTYMLVSICEEDSTIDRSELRFGRTVLSRRVEADPRSTCIDLRVALNKMWMTLQRRQCSCEVDDFMVDDDMGPEDYLPVLELVRDFRTLCSNWPPLADRDEFTRYILREYSPPQCSTLAPGTLQVMGWFAAWFGPGEK
jgi:peptidoglycan/xylan/chitin deacetylase (PgdA/CDA1 family)